jgi:hypothetical protein
MLHDYDYERLLILNNAYHNKLNESMNYDIQSLQIKTKLYTHQIKLINGMHSYKDKMIHGYIENNKAINSKIGIIGDPIGSGKTLSILAYIASDIQHFPQITCELTSNSSKYFFSHEICNNVNVVSTNLIIVPHHLFSYWENEIKIHTSMIYTSIETKRKIKGIELSQAMSKSSFVLTTNTCYKFVQEYATQYNIKWNNVFIDEASLIYLRSSDPILHFHFLWFITNNWIPLLFKHADINKSSFYFLKDKIQLHEDLESWLVDDMTENYTGELESSMFLKEYLPFHHKNRGSIVLRNTNTDIQSSMVLPPINNISIQCNSHMTLNSLTSYYLSKNRYPSISSEQTVELFQALNVEFIENKIYTDRQPDNKFGLITHKIEENECVICLESCKYPSIVNCCYNIYCGNCLLQNTLTNFKCPMCRSYLDIDKICCLVKTPQELQEYTSIKSKLDTCISLIANKKQGDKIIIYSSFNNIYYEMLHHIDILGFNSEKIEHNLFSQIKTLKNFIDGNTDILFINDIKLIAGISLSKTTHLVFYHELPVYVWRQVLLHSCQRIGRIAPLNVIHLSSRIHI